MKKYVYINSNLFNELYYLYISSLVGKLIKKGNKTKAITLFNILKENIKLETNKKKKYLLFY